MQTPKSMRQQQPPPFYGRYTGHPALAVPLTFLEDFVGAKYYCPVPTCPC